MSISKYKNKKTNDEIADLFDELAYWYALAGNVDGYKISTYKNAAFNLRQALFDICTASPKQIKSIKGVGPQLQNQIIKICQEDNFPELEKILSEIPQGVQEMAAINGLGPSKVNNLWRGLGIDSIEKLQEFIKSGGLEAVKGFGKKTVESISAEIERIEQNRYAMLYAQADQIGKEVYNYLISLFPEFTFSPLGDYARKSNTLTSIDFITNLSGAELLDEVSLMDKLLSHGEDPITYNFEDHIIRLYCRPDSQSFDSTVKEYNYTNEGQSFDMKVPLIQTEKYFQDLEPNPENWVTDNDINALIHCHSTYSDGKNSIEELALECIQRGYEYMVLSDHSQSAFYANGLSPERIKKQHQEILELNIKLAPFRIFKSIECDILSDGSLDYAEEILDEFDLLIASVHSGLKMDSAKATERLLKAINTGKINILGHWTGRLLLRRDGYTFDVPEIVRACKENNVVIEINANPRRLDADFYYIPYILQQGVKLSIDPDAHKIEGIDDIHWGVINAQKGGLRAQDNISSYSLEEFKKFFDLI